MSGCRYCSTDDPGDDLSEGDHRCPTANAEIKRLRKALFDMIDAFSTDLSTLTAQQVRALITGRSAQYASSKAYDI